MAILPLITIYNYDNTIFDKLTLPAKTDLDSSLPYIDNAPELSKDVLVSALLDEIGELTPLYTDPDVLRPMIGTWSRIWKPAWVKLWQTEIIKYNPIWNKDGTYKETVEQSGNTSGSTSNNSVNSYGRTDTHNVTGYDTNGFSPADQDVAGGSDSVSGNGNTSGRYENTETRTRTESGNIGVTTTQAMLKEEREAAAFNLYEHIIEAFKKRFCIMIY